MGRLIDTNDIRVKPQYMQDVMGIAMIRCEDLSRILADVPTVEAIPKAEYETRLKVDMVAMLKELLSDVEKMSNTIVERRTTTVISWVGMQKKICNLIQQKINELKAESEG